MMIEVRDLKKSFKIHHKEPGLKGSITSLFNRNYEEKFALKGVTFTMKEGDLVGLVGANGAGKTTLVKILSGIIHPTSGDAKILGHRPWERHNDYRSKMALIMGQKAQLWWDLPAMDSFLLLKEIYQIPEKQYLDTIDYLSNKLNIHGQLKVQVRKLSLGERMKVELMACLLHRPKVVFLDEPTIGLDITAQKAVREFIAEYQREFKPLMILTSHYMEDIEQLCKRLIIIREGEFVYDGNLGDVQSKCLGYKVIKIQLEAPLNQRVTGLPPFIELTSENEMMLSFKTPKDKIREASIYLLQLFAVKDLSIEESPIANIIEEIMLQGKVGSGHA